MDAADWLIGMALVCLALGMLGLLWLYQQGPPPPRKMPRHRRRKRKD